MLKALVKKISLSENESARFLILKWLYLIDSFPNSNTVYIFEHILSDLLLLLIDNSPEVYNLAKTKIFEIIDRYAKLNSKDLKKTSKLLKNVHLIH